MQEGLEIRKTNGNSAVRRRRKTVAYALGVVAIVLVAVLLTFSLTVNYYCNNSGDNKDLVKKLDVLSDYIEKYAYYDADYAAMEDAALKAFVSSAGDRYTVYYNADDFKALNDGNVGQYVGIGVSVAEEEVVYNDDIITIVEVIQVHEGSHASEVGITAGDMIYSVYTDEGEIFANDVDFDVFASLVKGEEGTNVNISILRMKNEELEKVNLTIERRKVVVKSVLHSIDTDNKIGVVSISQFDLNTPSLFTESVDAIKAEGINKIVIDMRDNGGGDLNSVVACASYFLNEGDLIMSAEDNEGRVVKHKARVKTLGGEYALCSVANSDIGKYKDLKVVVLVNENTASAAELLTAVLRDYELAPIVGVNTFGKGTMQTIYSLEDHGLDGGIKITTDVYFPPCGVNYDGVGIEPDVIVEYEIGDVDNQLEAAIKLIK